MRPIAFAALAAVFLAAAVAAFVALAPTPPAAPTAPGVPTRAFAAAINPGGINPGGTNPLCTTGLSPANGIVCKDAGAYLRALSITNQTDAAAWAVVADLTVIPTSFDAGGDGATGPGMLGAPILLPPSSETVLGTTYFGAGAGWATTTGLAIGISSTSTAFDAGLNDAAAATDAADSGPGPQPLTSFTPALPLFDITANGQ